MVCFIIAYMLFFDFICTQKADMFISTEPLLLKKIGNTDDAFIIIHLTTHT